MKCSNFDTLAAYFDGILDETESKKVEKHLEFCPICREVLGALQKEDAFLMKAIQAPRLPQDFDQHVLKDLTPYPSQRKKNSWKYQFLTACSIVLAFGLGASMYPELENFFGERSPVTEPMKQEEVKALYSVEHNGVTFNITEVSASPVKIEIFYEIEATEVMKERFRGNLLDNEMNNVLMSKDNEFPFISLKKENGEEVPFKNLDFTRPDSWNGSIILYPQDEPPNHLAVDIEINEILDEKGDWSFSIPIDLTESKKETTMLKLDDTLGIEGLYQLQLLEWINAPNAKMLKFESTFSDKELGRIQSSMKDRKDFLASSGVHLWLQPIYSVKTEAGKELLYSGASVSSTNGNHFLVETEFRLTERGERPSEKYKEEKHIFELNGFSVKEPVDAQFTLDIQQGTHILDDKSTDEWILTGYTAKLVDGKLKVKVTGKRGIEHATTLGWKRTGQDTETIYASINDEGGFELEFEMPGAEKGVQTVTIDFLSIDKTVLLPEPINVPLD
ncbi:zf-HC2 domain-containing protein [Sutcliffiella halmapala]